MVETEIELRSSAIVTRADLESLAYEDNDSSAFLSDSNGHLANKHHLLTPFRFCESRVSILKKGVIVSFPHAHYSHKVSNSTLGTIEYSSEIGKYIVH